MSASWEIVLAADTRHERVCDLGMSMQVFEYRNHDFDFSAHLYVRSDGLLSYASFGRVTDWHGTWKVQPDRRVQAKFHYEGNVNRLKQTILCKDDNGGYYGLDYRSRFITMKKKYENVYCHSCKCWHMVQE